MYDNMKELVGKTIKRILINSSDEILAFDTDVGIIAYETEGDCCSSTWFESVTGVEALLGQSPIENESIDLPAPTEERKYTEDKHYWEEMQDYGQKLKTQKGIVDIVYRNSSNGYYGGNINLLSSPPDVSDYKEITDDWTAA